MRGVAGTGSMTGMGNTQAVHDMTQAAAAVLAVCQMFKKRHRILPELGIYSIQGTEMVNI